MVLELLLAAIAGALWVLALWFRRWAVSGRNVKVVEAERFVARDGTGNVWATFSPQGSPLPALLAAFLILILGGCAAYYSLRAAHDWRREGATFEDLVRDRSECEKLARQAARPWPFSDEPRLYVKCMEDRGWK